MKIKHLLTIALLLFGVGHAFSLDTGYYLVKSYNDKYLTENAATNVNFSAGYSVSSGYAKAVDESGNLLKGTLVDMELDLSDNTTYYSLGKKNDKIGFYKFDNNGNHTISLGANKAYLDTPVATSARGFVFDVDNNTGISTMDDVRCKTDNIYDLSGRRVDSIKQGIYIVNGKKMIK